MLVNGIDASNLTKGIQIMAKRTKLPERAGKKAGAVKQAPEEFRLSNEQTTKAADLAKAINANFNKGDDEQAKAAMRLLEVRGMFPEGRPGNALFEAWCSEHISQSYKTVSNLLSYARKGNKADVLKALADSRDNAKARAQKSRDRQKAAETLHQEDKTQGEAACREAIKQTKAADGSPDLDAAREWLKEHAKVKEASDEDDTPSQIKAVRVVMAAECTDLKAFAVDLIKGMSSEKALALADAIMAEVETWEQAAPADQSENSGGNIADLKPETETGDGTAIPHTFKVKPGQSGADAAREKAA